MPMIKRIPILSSLSLFGAMLCDSLHAQEYALSMDANRVVYDLSDQGRHVLYAINNTLVVRDWVTGAEETVSILPTGETVRPDRGSLSADGRYVAFESSDYRTLYFRDRVTQTTRIISLAPDGTPANGRMVSPSISPDGRLVAFFTNATNLVSETLPAMPANLSNQGNLLIWNRDTGTISVGARAHDGSLLNAGVLIDPGTPLKRFSADGRYLFYCTAATNAFPGAAVTAGSYTLAYRRDLQTGEVRLVSSDASGNLVLGIYSYTIPNADGSKVAFIGQSLGLLGAGLVPGTPANIMQDAYVKDLHTGEVIWVTRTNDGKAPAGLVQGTYGRVTSPLGFSGDGRHVVFQTNATNLLPELNGQWGVVLTDLQGAQAQHRLISPSYAAGSGDTSKVEGINPIMSKNRLLVHLLVKERSYLGLPAGEGPVVYGHLPVRFEAPWQDAGEADGGLAHLPWFGQFLVAGNGFIWHPEHGWLYTLSPSTAALWLFDYGLGWVYTSDTVYPFLYSMASGGWLYYLPSGISGTRYFYDFSSNDWRVVP